jgi:hypothetical protein
MPSWPGAASLEAIGQCRRLAESEELGGAGLVVASHPHGRFATVSHNVIDTPIEINALVDDLGKRWAVF